MRLFVSSIYIAAGSISSKPFEAIVNHVPPCPSLFVIDLNISPNHIHYFSDLHVIQLN